MRIPYRNRIRSRDSQSVHLEARRDYTWSGNARRITAWASALN